MKTVNNIFKHTFFCLALGTTVCSCDLDVEPTSSIATETFWTSEKDAWYNLNAVYSASIPGAAVHSDSYTNDAYCQYSWESNGAIYQQNGLSALYDEGYNFETVRKQNIFLQEIENVPMDEDLKTRFKAEVRAMRAWTYLNLTTTFGKVPLITDVLSYDAPNIPRDETSKIREFILNELTEAAAILPEKYAGSYPNEKGRMTKYAALAVKARAALYFGDYPTAEAAAKEIMDKGGFSLFQVSELTEAQKKEAEEMELYIDFDKYGIDRDKFMKVQLRIFMAYGKREPRQSGICNDSSIYRFQLGLPRYDTIHKHPSESIRRLVFCDSDTKSGRRLLDSRRQNTVHSQYRKAYECL